MFTSGRIGKGFAGALVLLTLIGSAPALPKPTWSSAAPLEYIQYDLTPYFNLIRAGWPQATTVVYANEGLTIYFVCGPESQKVANLSRDNRVSLTIDHETPDVTEITGLSMAAHAQLVFNPAEASKALRMLRLKYPLLPVPMPEDVTIFRVTPTIISVIDYSKGFGHTDLVTC